MEPQSGKNKENRLKHYLRRSGRKCELVFQILYNEVGVDRTVEKSEIFLSSMNQQFAIVDSGVDYGGWEV